MAIITLIYNMYENEAPILANNPFKNYYNTKLLTKQMGY